MISKSFIESAEYQEFKQILAEEIQLKPLKIKTDGKSNETIAREITAFEIASKMISRSISKFEKKAVLNQKEKQRFI